MKILFMGTPDFAAYLLRSLMESGHEICGVVTQPDKPKGRGYQLMPPPVKVLAVERGCPVFQPTTLKGEEFAALLRQLDPEIIVVAAYGKILPPSVLSYPKYGCVNAHASLLPKYRGAAPIQRAILEGEKETGVTAMYMAEGLDTGDMIGQVSVRIEANDTFETLHDKLCPAAAEAIGKALEAIENGTVCRIPQNEALACYASKITKEDSILDFSRPASDLSDQIRGLSPFPLAFTHFPDGKMLKIVSAEYGETEAEGQPGEVVSTALGRIAVKTGRGTLYLTGVLPEGKGRMKASDLINGRRIRIGDVLKTL